MAINAQDEVDGAVADLVRAVRVQGAYPAYHREIMAKHRREWPALWNAIDRILTFDELRHTTRHHEQHR